MITKIINTTDKNRCNCVLYARSQGLIFPTGMWTIEDKKKIIDSQKPKVGCLVIMNVGIWYYRNGIRVFSGHLGIVEKISYTTKKCACCGAILTTSAISYLTIRDANYVKCKVTRRSGTPVELKVLGYRLAV